MMLAGNSEKALHDQTTSIEKFLEAAAAKQPTPGGGSVAALAGALAASMGEMVVNYSVGKKGLEAHAPKLKQTLGKFHKARKEMLKLMRTDQSSYEMLTSAKKTSADDPERESKIAVATLYCITSPDLIAVRATEIIRLADGVVEKVNPYLLSDLAVCVELAMATTRAALYNVRVNLPGVVNAKKRREIEERCERTLSRAVALVQRVIPRIWERAAQV
jgi:methenyltetrahydrofolate cyclohydrolase